MDQGQLPANRTAGRDQAARGVVKALEAAFNARNETLVAAQFADEASWTGTDGSRFQGRAAIAALARRSIAALGRLDVRLTVTAMQHLRPDVSVVYARQDLIDADGTMVFGTLGVPLYVLSREPDGWKVAAGQNMVVLTPPDPVTRR